MIEPVDENFDKTRVDLKLGKNATIVGAAKFFDRMGKLCFFQSHFILPFARSDHDDGERKAHAR